MADDKTSSYAQQPPVEPSNAQGYESKSDALDMHDDKRPKTKMGRGGGIAGSDKENDP